MESPKAPRKVVSEETSVHAPTPNTVYWNYLGRIAAAAFLVAFVVNAGLTALLFFRYRTVSFLGGTSIVVDLFLTGQVVPIVVMLVTNWWVRTRLERGAIPLSSPSRTLRSRRLLPLPLWMRAIVLGIHGVVAAIVVSVALWLASIDSMSFWRFVLFQGVFAGVLAAYVAALTAHRLIADAAAERASREPAHVPQRVSTTGIRP
jgi:hypothetical protein